MAGGATRAGQARNSRGQRLSQHGQEEKKASEFALCWHPRTHAASLHNLYFYITTNNLLQRKSSVIYITVLCV